MEKYNIPKSQARKVMMKLRIAHSQMYKTVQSVGVDYYGLLRLTKQESAFWSAQTKGITSLANRIKKRYHIPD